MQTNMDLNQDETIATDDDSGEVDESFYLSRSSSDLRLTLTNLPQFCIVTRVGQM